MKCPKCNGEMKELFTSSYCPKCDTESEEDEVTCIINISPPNDSQPVVAPSDENKNSTGDLDIAYTVYKDGFVNVAFIPDKIAIKSIDINEYKLLIKDIRSFSTGYDSVYDQNALVYFIYTKDNVVIQVSPEEWTTIRQIWEETRLTNE